MHTSWSSILQAFEGIMEVLGTAGDSSLGGNDFDRRLASWVLAQAGCADDDRQAQGWAVQAAEAAKVALSAGDAASVALPGGASLDLSRQQFEEASSELFQLMANVLEALGDALFVQWAVRPSDAVPGRPAAAAAAQQQPAGADGAEGSDAGSGSGSGSDSGSDRWAPPPRRITQVALVGQLTRLPSVQQFVATITGALRTGCCGVQWASLRGVQCLRATRAASPVGRRRARLPSCLFQDRSWSRRLASTAPACRCCCPCRRAAAHERGSRGGGGAGCCHPRGRAAGGGAAGL